MECTQDDSMGSLRCDASRALRSPAHLQRIYSENSKNCQASSPTLDALPLLHCPTLEMDGLSWRQGCSDWVTCPYNNGHKMPLETLQWHIAKVHKPEVARKNMANCPYNFNHMYVTPNIYQLHTHELFIYS